MIKMNEDAKLTITIIRDVCSNCTPQNIPKDKLPKKLGIQIIIAGKTVILCYDCLRLLIAKIEDISNNGVMFNV